MKDFLKYTLASIIGTALALFIVFFLSFAIVAGAISSALSDLDPGKRTASVKDGSVLHLKLNRPISDRGPEKDFQFNFIGMSTGAPMGLNQLLETLENAGDDARISGILLDVSAVLAGMATVEEIRNALINFKAKGKWIVAYSEVYTQKAYYLASIADQIYMYPEGMLDFRGLNVQYTFFKRMLDKVEIEAQIIRGSNNKFKSFAEPFMLESMSEANKQQTTAWMEDLWATMVQGVATARGLSESTVIEAADKYQLQSPEDATTRGFVTKLAYWDEVEADLRTRTETDSGKKLPMVTYSEYRRAGTSGRGDKKFVPSYKKPRIAVIYAEGDIISGKSGEGSIGSETFAEAIREAREDSTVKAVVLRVNSGGGSALASDVIHRETALLKGTKPFIVSMGDVAASGGYYIASHADKIMVMPNTITGSIGVIGLIPNMKGMLNNKIGLTFDGVKTGEFADFIDVTRPLTPSEYRILQEGVDRTYGVFLNKVATGRGMTVARVDSLGQGKVYSGEDAIALGLADTLGGLKAAVELAARMASIDDYSIRTLPKRKEPLEEFFESLQARVAEQAVLRYFGHDAQTLHYFKEAASATRLKGIQMHMLAVPVID
jgi:protease-4